MFEAAGTGMEALAFESVLLVTGVDELETSDDSFCGSSRRSLQRAAMSVDSLTMQLRELQAKLVKALQEEYFCEDLEPPPAAFGWDADALQYWCDRALHFEAWASVGARLHRAKPHRLGVVARSLA